MLTFISGGHLPGHARMYDAADSRDPINPLRVEYPIDVRSHHMRILTPAARTRAQGGGSFGPVRVQEGKVPPGEHFYGHIRSIWHGG